MNKTLYQRLWSLAKASTVIAFLLGGAQVAMADVAANHIVRNTATVNYTDAGGINPDSDSDFVDITINLVAAAPTVAFDAAASTQDLLLLGTNQAVSLVYDVTSNANGVDTYTVADASTGTGTVAVLGATPSSPVELGGTVYSGAAPILAGTFPSDADGVGGAVAAVILVASDNDSSDSITNGLAVDDFVKIGTAVCQVHDVTEDGTEENGSTLLEVDRCVGTTSDLAVGDQIGERLQVTLSFTTNEIIGALVLTTDFTSATDNGVATQVGESAEILATNLLIHKFVRNTNGGQNSAGVDYNPDCADTACLVVNSVIYFKSLVTADPTHTLQYALLVFNAGGIVTNVKVMDPIVAFTSYTVDTTALVPFGTTTGGTACSAPVAGIGSTCNVAETPVASTTNDDDSTATGFVFLNGTTLTVAAGHNGDGSTPEITEVDGGQVNAGEVSVVLFDVLIN
jgi:hypothetical protein